MHEVYTVSHLLGALPRSAQTGNPRVVHELGLALQHSKHQPTMAMNTCFLIHGTVGHLGPLWFRAAPRVSFWDSGSLGHALLADSERSDDDRPGHTCTSLLLRALAEASHKDKPHVSGWEIRSAFCKVA